MLFFSFTFFFFFFFFFFTGVLSPPLDVFSLSRFGRERCCRR